MAVPDVSLTPLILIASLVIIGLLSGMVLAWTWALDRLRRGEPLLPPPRFRIVPWGAGSVLVLLMAWFLAQNAVAYVHYKATGRLGSAESVEETKAGQPDAEGNGNDKADAEDDGNEAKPPPWTARDQIIINAAIVCMLLPLIVIILRRTSGATLADMGFTSQDVGRNLTRGFAACLLVAPICYGTMLILSQFLGKPEEHLLITTVREQFTVGTALLTFASAVVLAPIFEELTFRGVLLPWLERLIANVKPPRGTTNAAPEDELAEPNSTQEAPITRPAEVAQDMPGPGERTIGRNALWQANVITSVIFAMLHAKQWPAPVALFVLSMTLGTLIQRTGSLWAPIALHAAFNGLSTSALFLALYIGVEEPVEEAIPPPVSAPAEAAAVINATGMDGPPPILRPS